jgi:hypothetical protein
MLYALCSNVSLECKKPKEIRYASLRMQIIQSCKKRNVVYPESNQYFTNIDGSQH